MTKIRLSPNATIFQGDCLKRLKKLPSESIQMCVTSPPYFGLRDYGHDGQIGLEETPEQYIEKLVAVFREVRRLLRKDGTLWLNIGDSYAANRSYQVPSTKGGVKHGPGQAAGGRASVVPDGLKPKDLVGIPWMLAFALRADGWYLRQDIIWHKPNPMPESVGDRCTKAHEYLFLLSKSQKYFFDNEAIKEQAIGGQSGAATKFKRANSKRAQAIPRHSAGTHRPDRPDISYDGLLRNRRSVWTINTKPYKGAHFAVYPSALVEPCILAGTSEAGHCPECGARAVRKIEKHTLLTGNSAKAGRTPEEINSSGKHRGGVNGGNKNLKSGPSVVSRTIGWKRGCECGSKYVSDIVLDPFNGSGTTGQVALERGRRYVGLELNPEYVELTKKRLAPVIAEGSRSLFGKAK